VTVSPLLLRTPIQSRGRWGWGWEVEGRSSLFGEVGCLSRFSFRFLLRGTGRRRTEEAVSWQRKDQKSEEGDERRLPKRGVSWIH